MTAAGGVESSELAITCCVESGPLERQTVHLVESLRRWGGAYRDVKVVAVTPRLGPPLLRTTRAALDRLGVDYVRYRARAPYLWQHYMNKPLALGTAIERAGTPFVAWFDSDIVVVGEPAGLLPGPGEDFVACPRDRGVIGSTGPDDPNDAYWREIAGVAGLELDDLPWITTVEEGMRIRLYWNSGVFAFRAASGLVDDYLALNVDLLDARIGSRDKQVHYNDQVALGLSMLRTGLRWRPLGGELNCGVSRWHPYVPEALATARVVHYHDSLRADFFPELVRRVGVHHPEVGRWLQEAGPLRPSPLATRAAQRALRAVRGLRRRRYYRHCRWV